MKIIKCMLCFLNCFFFFKVRVVWFLKMLKINLVIDKKVFYNYVVFFIDLKFNFGFYLNGILGGEILLLFYLF